MGVDNKSVGTSLANVNHGANSFGTSSPSFGHLLAIPDNVDTLRLLRKPSWWSKLKEPKLGLYASIAASVLLLVVLIVVLVYFLVGRACNPTTKGATCAPKQENATCSVVNDQCVCAATSSCADVVFDSTSSKTATCQPDKGKLDITCPTCPHSNKCTCDDITFGTLQGTCDDSNDKAQVTCPMATQDAFDVEVGSTWTNVTSDNKCQSTLAINDNDTYCGKYDVDNNNQIQGGAHTGKTFNVLDLMEAMTSMDPNKQQPYPKDVWQYFHNVCYNKKCIGFSVANEGPNDTNMVYYPCLYNDDSPTTNNKPPNLPTTNLGTVIVNNASTNCLPSSKC